MIRSQRARPAAGHAPTPTAATGVTIYGCDEDEAVLFRALAPRFGVVPTITGAPVSAENADLASGNRCVSVGHKTDVTRATLLALSRAGVWSAPGFSDT